MHAMPQIYSQSQNARMHFALVRTLTQLHGSDDSCKSVPALQVLPSIAYAFECVSPQPIKLHTKDILETKQEMCACMHSLHPFMHQEILVYCRR